MDAAAQELVFFFHLFLLENMSRIVFSISLIVVVVPSFWRLLICERGHDLPTQLLIDTF